MIGDGSCCKGNTKGPRLPPRLTPLRLSCLSEAGQAHTTFWLCVPKRLNTRSDRPGCFSGRAIQMSQSVTSDASPPSNRASLSGFSLRSLILPARAVVGCRALIVALRTFRPQTTLMTLADAIGVNPCRRHRRRCCGESAVLAGCTSARIGGGGGALFTDR